MMTVEVNAGQRFDVCVPTPLFQTPPGTIVGDVTSDGKRFLLVTPAGPSASGPFTVVLNWTTGLKSKKRFGYCFSNTVVLSTFWPWAFVPVVVTVRVLPSLEITCLATVSAFPLSLFVTSYV